MQQTKKFSVTESGSPKVQPEKKFRAGAVSATIWRNSSEKGPYSTISLERGYKDKNGQWQKATSLRLNDLPRAAVVLEEAYKYLVMKSSETTVSENSLGLDHKQATINSQYDIEEIVY
jgi:hypothetical protein